MAGTQSENIKQAHEKGRVWRVTTKFNCALLERAIALRAEGKLFREIGELLGVHKNTVRYWFRTDTGLRRGAPR